MSKQPLVRPAGGRRCVPFALALVAAATVAPWAWPARARAQSQAQVQAEQPCEDRPPMGRVLDDHLFLPSDLVRDPFTATYFDLRNAYGYATATGPTFNVAGTNIGNRDYRIATLLQSFDLQAKIFDWWAIRLGAQGVIFSGVDGTSALNVGISARFAPSAGTTFSWPVGHRVRLGATFDFGYTPDVNVNVISGVVRSVSTASLNLRNLLTDTRLTFYQPGASVAVAIHRALGFVGTVDYLHIGSDTGGVTDTIDTVSWGAAFDFDARALSSKIPIGVILAYKFNDPATHDNSEASHSLDLGFYYTGVRHLLAGFIFGERWFNLLVGPPGGGFLPFEARVIDTSLSLGQLQLRYTW
jgi:hypothetical protein